VYMRQGILRRMGIHRDLQLQVAESPRSRPFLPASLRIKCAVGTISRLPVNSEDTKISGPAQRPDLKPLRWSA
jgi:hypothetical protein